MLRDVSMSWMRGTGRDVPGLLAPPWQLSKMQKGCPRNVAPAGPGQTMGSRTHLFVFFFFKHWASHSSCCMHTNASVCSIIGHLFWWSCYRNFTASVSKQPYNDSFTWIAHGKTPYCLFSWQTVFWLTCKDAMRFLPDVKCCSCSVAEPVPRASSTGQLNCLAPLTVAWVKADCRQSPAGDKGAEQWP